MTRTKVAYVLGLLVLVSAVGSAQAIDTIVAGAELNVGYTIVDLPTALDWDERFFEEWDQIYGRVEAHALFFRAGPVLLGASAAWNRLYYYWVRIPWIPSPLNYEGTVQPVSVGALGEIELTENLQLRAGADVVIFRDGVTVGVRSTVSYRFPLGEAFAAYAGGTANVIFGSGLPIGVGLAVGVDYTIDL